MSKYTNHQFLLKSFMLEAQKKFPTIRIFQRHVGQFYTMRGTPIKINKKGMSDAWAWFPVDGKVIAFEFEIKTGKAVQTKEQKNWEKFCGGMCVNYLTVRDVDDALEQIEEIIKKNS